MALQLAQWMAETGQAAKDEITGGWRAGAGGRRAGSAMHCRAAEHTPRLLPLPTRGCSPTRLPLSLPLPLLPPLPAALFDRATSLEPKSEAVLFRYAVYLDEVRDGYVCSIHQQLIVRYT